jgi:hypothetical protein
VKEDRTERSWRERKKKRRRKRRIRERGHTRGEKMRKGMKTKQTEHERRNTERKKEKFSGTCLLSPFWCVKQWEEVKHYVHWSNLSAIFGVGKSVEEHRGESLERWQIDDRVTERERKRW